jgi:hypothetical protein
MFISRPYNFRNSKLQLVVKIGNLSFIKPVFWVVGRINQIIFLDGQSYTLLQFATFNDDN